jgi:hypothetical protein
LNDLYLDITPLSNRRDHSIRQTFLVSRSPTTNINFGNLKLLLNLINIDKYTELIALAPLLSVDNFDIFTSRLHHTKI